MTTERIPAVAADTTDSGFATRFGAVAETDAYGPQAVFPPVTPEGVARGFASPLPDLGLLSVSGDEGAKFLHAQLTNDVEHLAEGEARWYGYCSPKGRLLATFVGWRDAQGIALALARPRVEPIRKRLSMFVLRAKAKVLDRSESTRLFGLGGAAGAAALQKLGISAPAPMGAVHGEGFSCIGLPEVAIGGAPCPRWLLAVQDEAADALWHALTAELVPVSSSVWRWTEVLAAVPRIVEATAELFVPQMLNFEVVGGVNFKKGCYPGQEIVARSQYLGKLKRRMFVAHLAGTEPAPGSDVFPASGGEPCGQVVMAAPSPSGGIDLLFESQTAALDAGSPTAGGTPMVLGTLPYAMPG
jgi:folate-binding protein YgfZ